MTVAGAPPRTVAEVAGRLGAAPAVEIVGDGAVEIERVSSIDGAAAGSLVFVHDVAYAGRFADSAASAALVTRGVAIAADDPRPRIVVDDAEIAMATVLETFAVPPVRPPAGVHPSAVVDPTAEVDPTAAIGPLATIGPGARIAAGAILHAGVHVRAGASIGPRTELHPGVVVGERCRIGADGILHPGVVIGADGFGYRPAPDGSGLLKMPHLGAVAIGDRVEIGASTCVDRGKLEDTVIEDGVKLDNLVQVGHNCRIGAHTVIAGLSGLAGSVVLGRGVQMGGQAAVKDHVRVGDGARIAARAAVMDDVPPGEAWAGAPAAPRAEALRQWAAIRTLPGLIRRLRRVAPELLAGPERAPTPGEAAERDKPNRG